MYPFLCSLLAYCLAIKIVIDVACVLADLGYSFLSTECVLPGDPDFPAWLEVLATISLVINTFFLIEIPFTLWTFGFRYFTPLSGIPHAAFHFFDAIIIITTLVLELILKGKEREIVGLLIALRMWRLIKLVGGNVTRPFPGYLPVDVTN